MEEKKKFKINRKTLIILMFIMICILLTVIMIRLKIKKIYSSNIPNNENTNENVEENETLYDVDSPFNNKDKENDNEKKYLCNINEKYSFNSLEIKDIIDDKINYIEISGLKNKTIQDRINTEIKDVVYKQKQKFSNSNNVYIRCEVAGNFANILSLYINCNSYGDNNNYERSTETLNYDLNTGNKIKFEDLFIKSTPIKLPLIEAVYEALAFSYEVKGEFGSDEFMDSLNMDNRDTSEYEDIFLKVSSIYDNIKNDLKFIVSPYQISIYELPIEQLDRVVKIDMYKYKDYIAIYKRYLLGNDIYEKDIGMKDIYTFTIPFSNVYCKNYEHSYYGYPSKNLFTNVSYQTSNMDSNINKVLNSCYSNVDQKMNTFKQEANNNPNQNYIIQGWISADKATETSTTIPYIRVYFDYEKVEVTNEVFDNLQYYLNYVCKMPKASIDGFFIMGNERFVPYNKDKSVLESKYWYYDLDGNYLGDSEECIKKNNVNNNS